MKQIHNYPELHYEVSNLKHVLIQIMVYQQNDNEKPMIKWNKCVTLYNRAKKVIFLNLEKIHMTKTQYSK